jgi:rhodanese-related sulfurtransferase
MDAFFANQGLLIEGVVHLSPREALAAVQRGAALVDLREVYELETRRFDLPGVVFLPSSGLASGFERLPKEQPLVLADSVGLRSKEALLWLRTRGFGQLANLNGGIVDWERDGLPLDVVGHWVGGCVCKMRVRKTR